MSLSVIVCVKQVVYDKLPYVPDKEGRLVPNDKIEPVYAFNPSDRYALEHAISLRQKLGAFVTALTLGPDRAQNVLKTCLARGADAAVHLVCAEETYAWQSAALVAQALDRRRPDLILCGEESLDDASAIFGPLLAERLGWPQLTHATALDVTNGEILVRRQLERGDHELLACRLPAIVTVRPFGVEPQYVPVLEAMLALSQKIEQRPVDCNQLPTPQLRLVETRVPRTFPRRLPMPAPTLGAAGRIDFLMSGGRVKKNGDTFQGTPEQAAERIFQFLKERSFV
jgi:electron transfer flavoprotein beta subunit